MNSPAIRPCGQQTEANSRDLSLADFTETDLVFPTLPGSDVAAVVQELSRALHRAQYIPDVLPFYHAALNREFLAATVTETGVAFPHARIQGSDRLCFAFGHCSQAIRWGGKHGPEVRLVFLIAAPATAVDGYLAFLNSLVQLVRREANLQALLAAATPGEVIDLLRQVPLKAPSVTAPLFDELNPIYAVTR